MKFVELKKDLSVNIKPVYILNGGDSFLISRANELIFEALNLQILDLNFIKFNNVKIDLQDVVRACETMPVLDDKKMVYLNIDNFTSLQNVSALTKYLKKPNEGCVLVINANDIKDCDFFGEKVDCNKLEGNILYSFVVSQFAKFSKKITTNALKQLISLCNYDLAKIVTEIEKLCFCVGERETIKEDDINENVAKTIEFQIFELTDAIIKNNRNRVFEITETLKNKKTELKQVLPVIFNHFRRLLHVSIGSYNKTELANLLNVKEYAITIAINQAKNFKPIWLKEINDICLELDFQTKQSLITIENAIDFLVLKLLNYNK